MAKRGRPRIEKPKPSAYSGVGYLIRDHLRDVGEDYIANCHRAYKQALKNDEEAHKIKGQLTVLYKRARYLSFARYFWWFVQLSLLEKVRVEPARYSQLHDRTYYRLTDKGLDPNSLWTDPIAQLHPEWAGSKRRGSKYKRLERMEAQEGPGRPWEGTGKAKEGVKKPMPILGERRGLL